MTVRQLRAKLDELETEYGDCEVTMWIDAPHSSGRPIREVHVVEFANTEDCKEVCLEEFPR